MLGCFSFNSSLATKYNFNFARSVGPIFPFPSISPFLISSGLFFVRKSEGDGLEFCGIPVQDYYSNEIEFYLAGKCGEFRKWP